MSAFCGVVSEIDISVVVYYSYELILKLWSLGVIVVGDELVEIDFLFDYDFGVDFVFGVLAVGEAFEL